MRVLQSFYLVMGMHGAFIDEEKREETVRYLKTPI